LKAKGHQHPCPSDRGTGKFRVGWDEASWVELQKKEGGEAGELIASAGTNNNAGKDFR